MILRIICLVLVSSISGIAFADDEQKGGPPPGVDDEGWSFFVGGGGFYAPTYSGDDDYQANLVPFIRITKGDEFFLSVQEGAGWALVNDDGFRAGPLATLDFGRDEDGASPFAISGDVSPDLIGLGDVDFTVALGGFAEYETGDVTFKLRAGRAVSSHEGMTAELAMDYNARIMSLGPPLIISAGPRLKWADNKYNQAYYGITSDQALASGLPVFDADSGLVSFGLGANAILPLSRDGLGLTIFGSYDRLTGDASDSPLVRQRGSADQFFGGAAIAYRF